MSLVTCPQCNGRGIVQEGRWEVGCSNCGGRGKYRPPLVLPPPRDPLDLVECVCGTTVQWRNWQNHLFSQRGVHRAVEGEPGVPPKTPQHRHGTVNGYTNRRCRCDDCTEAWRVYCSGLRSRKNATVRALPAALSGVTEPIPAQPANEPLRDAVIEAAVAWRNHDYGDEGELLADAALSDAVDAYRAALTGEAR